MYTAQGTTSCGEIARITLPETNSKFAPENWRTKPQNDPQWNLHGDVRAGILQYKTVLPAYKMMSFHFLNYAPKNELALIQKVGIIRAGWARETQVHPTSSNINVKKMINHQITTKWLDSMFKFLKEHVLKQNPTDPAVSAGLEPQKVGIWQIEILKKLKIHNMHAPKSHASSETHCCKSHNPNQQKTYFP